MKKVKVSVNQDDLGDWWVKSDEVIGLFVCGDTRKDALENAKFALSIEFDVDEDEIDLEIIDSGVCVRSRGNY